MRYLRIYWSVWAQISQRCWKNISFRFLTFFIFFQPSVFFQKAKCALFYDIRFTERETTYSKSSSISQHNGFSICLKFTTKISKSEPKVKNCHEHHCFNVLNLYCAYNHTNRTTVQFFALLEKSIQSLSLSDSFRTIEFVKHWRLPSWEYLFTTICINNNYHCKRFIVNPFRPQRFSKKYDYGVPTF